MRLIWPPGRSLPTPGLGTHLTIFQMAKEWLLALLLMLLAHQETRGERLASCPDWCQCFTPAQMLCADPRMADLPRNVSAEVREVIVMTSAVRYLFTNTFQDSSHLTKLVFLNNDLRSVHSRERLLHLKLNFNRFAIVPPGIFDSLKQLETLQMRSNNISSLSPFLFMNLQKLQVLDLCHNNLLEVTKDTFAGLLNLQILRINSNCLSNLTADIFHSVSQLSELHLEGNKITELKEGTFQVLTKLKVLNLRRNFLSVFTDGVFGSEISPLTELNLQDNMLTEVSPLNRLSSVTHLILSFNQLTMRLHGNPWKCDCHLWYLHDQLLNSSRKVEMLNRIQCESPQFLRNRFHYPHPPPPTPCHSGQREGKLSDTNTKSTTRCCQNVCGISLSS
uniref:LRRCT domain-containing protein n=1 Tax=Oryzias latipes TaxID=8090 RepID=A0A3P9HEC5_ORYLA